MNTNDLLWYLTGAIQFWAKCGDGDDSGNGYGASYGDGFGYSAFQGSNTGCGYGYGGGSKDKGNPEGNSKEWGYDNGDSVYGCE